MEQTAELTLRKSIVVDRPPEHAFRVFTEGIGGWWPVRSHSVGQERAEAAVMECKEGGRLYERLTDGTEAEWGRITAWEPPHRVAFTWYPGRDDGTAQQVDVRFSPEGEGTCVEVEQRGWERLGDRAQEMFESYEEGWDPVLARFGEAVSRSRL